MPSSDIIGIAAAILASLLGGTAVAGTRLVVSTMDPIAVAAIRYAMGALCLAPMALLAVRPIYHARQIGNAIALGLLFFGIFPYLFTLSLAYTTAARGALALSTLPLFTLALAVMLGREVFSWARLLGILIAMTGVAYVLSPRIGSPSGASLQGDLLMIAAAIVGAIYNVLSLPLIRTVGAVRFTAFGMIVGATGLILAAWPLGTLSTLAETNDAQWTALAYLGVVGCAVTFVFWSIGLHMTSPTVVALTVTLNPVAASVVGNLILDEPITVDLMIGLITVFAGIGLATNVLVPRALQRRL